MSKASDINCIRVYADEAQIKSCKESLAKVAPSVEKLSRALSLAGNEVRLSILYLLHNDSRLCVCDLSDVLEMKTPAVSQHLRKLKDAGIVNSNKIGQTIFYEINADYQSVLLPIFQLLDNNKVLSLV